MISKNTFARCSGYCWFYQATFKRDNNFIKEVLLTMQDKRYPKQRSILVYFYAVGNFSHFFRPSQETSKSNNWHFTATSMLVIFLFGWLSRKFYLINREQFNICRQQFNICRQQFNIWRLQFNIWRQQFNICRQQFNICRQQFSICSKLYPIYNNNNNDNDNNNNY